jgi:hypothetical protein
MKDYNSIRTICEENSRISRKVIDEFLIYYTAGRNNLEQVMNKRFAVYKHVTRELKTEWVNMLKAQYLAHVIFRKDGTIKKLLNHAELERLTREERTFLEQRAKHPWRFSFSVIIKNPASDFYLMEDVFSYEQFTLFSPGITDLIKKQSPILWFNLIGYNGACWQSYGPIGAYNGFEPDDIYFFATELMSEIEDENEIMEDLESNPVPYMMLLSGANYPLTFHKKDQLVLVMSEFDQEKINTKELRSSFKTEYNDGVYRFTHKEWGEPPHFSTVFFDERKKVILLQSMTERGYHALVTVINKYGFTFPDDPLIRVNTSMLVTAKNILKKDIVLNEYDELFEVKSSEKSQREIDKLNDFMALVLPDINAGRIPDVEKYAKITGVDIKTAHDLVRNVLGKFDDMDKYLK